MLLKTIANFLKMKIIKFNRINKTEWERKKWFDCIGFRDRREGKNTIDKGEGKKKNQIRLSDQIYKIPSCGHLPLHSKKKERLVPVVLLWGLGIGTCCVVVR